MKKVLATSLLAVVLTFFFTACQTTTQNPNTNNTTTNTTTTSTTSTTNAKHDVAYYSSLVESFSISLPEFSSPAELTPKQAYTLFKFFDQKNVFHWNNSVEGKGKVFPYTYVRDVLQKYLEYDMTPQIRSLKDGESDSYYDAELDAWVVPGEIWGFGGMRFSKNVSVDRAGDIVTIVQDFYNEDFSIKYARCTFVIHEYPDYYALLSYTSIDYVD